MVHSGRPVLTVITPSLNHGRFIGVAIASARLPAALPFEHLVIDAASTDETAAVLAGWPHLQVHVQPALDSHEALNHALALAQGEVIGFLNADDRYEPGALEHVLAYFSAHPEAEVLCGGLRVFTDDGAGEQDVARFLHCPPASMGLEMTFGNPGFNSWFFRRSLLQRLDGFRGDVPPDVEIGLSALPALSR